MNIAMIGTGYVGLVSGTCFSEFGYRVTCIDKNAEKIAALQRSEIPIYEPGLEELVRKNQQAGRLQFSTDLKAAVSDADVVFIAVGTPPRIEDGFADLTYVFQAAEEIGKALKGRTLVVTKSTVPVGTGRMVADIIRQVQPEADFTIASNPEFLREGSAIEDFMKPDRVVIGVEDEETEKVMRQLYRPLNDTAIVITDIASSELIKYAANCFLAVKVGFINEMANLCEALGADVQEVARGIGLDKRIGQKFLRPGPGFGGSCFPKDALALTKMADAVGIRSAIVETAIASNEERKGIMLYKIFGACGNSVKGKTIAVLGLTFKPNTDDMRESPSLVIVPGLVEAGAKVRVYDPKGMDEAKKIWGKDYPDIRWCNDVYKAASQADALVILTEWNEFRQIDFEHLKGVMKTPRIIDLRNIYTLGEMQGTGFEYLSIGRKTLLLSS